MSMCLTAVTLGHIVVIGTLVSGTTATEFDGGLHRASVNVAPLSSVSSPPPPPPPPQQLRPIRVATPAPPTSPDGPLSLGFDLTFLSLTDHPTAVCNDGSPAAYYIHKGTDPTRWVVHMQGGWWCWDQYSCQVQHICAFLFLFLSRSSTFYPVTPSHPRSFRSLSVCVARRTQPRTQPLGCICALAHSLADALSIRRHTPIWVPPRHNMFLTRIRRPRRSR